MRKKRMGNFFNISNLVFAQAWWLLLLIGIPILYFYFLKNKSINRLSISTITLLPKQKKPWQAIILHALPYIYLMALASMIIAMARPQLKNTTESTSGSGIDIMLSLDISGSMLAQDFTPNRLEVAKDVVGNFIQGRPYDRLGLVIFSGESFTQCPLTTDHQILLRQVSAVRSGILEDGTAIGMGLATAVDRLKASDAKSKIIILLTDGVNNMGLIDPLTALEIAKAMKMKVYTIGVGTMGMAKMPIGKNAFNEWVFADQKVEIDEPLMNKIANETGGKYYRCTDNKTLQKVYQEIDRLEKSKININTHSRLKELYYPFLFFSLIVFMMGFLTRYLLLKMIG
jgi:Ca-activated chloride channel homolog